MENQPIGITQLNNNGLELVPTNVELQVPVNEVADHPPASWTAQANPIINSEDGTYANPILNSDESTYANPIISSEEPSYANPIINSEEGTPANSIIYSAEASHANPILTSEEATKEVQELKDASGTEGAATAGDSTFNNLIQSSMERFPRAVAASEEEEDVGISLYLPEDEGHLSEFQIIVRQQLEFFKATQTDVEDTKQGRKRKTQMGQVGLRCVQCSHLPLRARGTGAVYYPRTLGGVYQAAQSMALAHLCVACPQIPPEIRVRLFQLRSKNRREPAGRGRDYWSQKCKLLGLYEDNETIRLKPKSITETEV